MSDTSATAAVEPGAQPPHPLREFWQYFCQNRGALAGLIIVAVVVFTALGADFLAAHHPDEQYRDSFLAPPFWYHDGSLRFLLGTDAVGRDIFSRIIHGARYSLVIGFIVVSLALSVGIALGLLATTRAASPDSAACSRRW